jgi:hypothetical protein
VRRLGMLAALGVVTALAIGGAAMGGGTVSPFAAHTHLTRTYNWTVAKSDDHHSAVTLAINESVNVTYSVTVTNTGSTDSDWFVEDGMPIESDGSPFTINSIGDVSASADQGGTITNATVNVCSLDPNYAPPVSFPFTGDFVGCHWQVSLPSGSPGVVTASVKFADASTASNTKAFDFTNPLFITEVNKCVDASDSYAGPLGTVCVGDSPKTFTYQRTIGGYDHCGDFTVDNTATIANHDTHGVLGTSSDTIHVTVPCHGTGCTLTQGYWKTHSKYGPAAKPDPTWNLLPGGLGPDTVFFKSGQTWIQVFNTPVAGNVYYDLAHQYEAAVLNILNGASSTPAVDAAIAAAANFFNTYTPAQAGALAKSSTARQNAIGWAATLGSYNEGAIGPGHCDEDH